MRGRSVLQEAVVPRVICPTTYFNGVREYRRDQVMDVMSWNVQGEIGISTERMQQQLETLGRHISEIDVFLFQAVHYERTADGVASSEPSLTIWQTAAIHSSIPVIGPKSLQPRMSSHTPTSWGLTTAAILSPVGGLSSVAH